MAVFGSKAIAGYGTIYIGKCAECKQPFSYTKYHKYVRKDGGTKIYCSWHCFRAKAEEYEAKEREKFQKECEKAQAMEERKAEFLRRRRARKLYGEEFDNLADAEDMIEYAERKVKEYTQKFLAAVPGTQERNYARRNLTNWEKELIRLKDVAKKMSTGGEQNVQEADE